MCLLLVFYWALVGCVSGRVLVMFGYVPVECVHMAGFWLGVYMFCYWLEYKHPDECGWFVSEWLVGVCPCMYVCLMCKGIWFCVCQVSNMVYVWMSSGVCGYPAGYLVEVCVSGWVKECKRHGVRLPMGLQPTPMAAGFLSLCIFFPS